MNMTTQQLQYLIEIERTRSVSQAASNLYMGQPNLSRILRETETALGFDLFERTRKGVRPTEKGAVFLQHARNILREAEFIERLGPNAARQNQFHVCLPRSFSCMEAVRRFLTDRASTNPPDAVLRECHPRQAMELVESAAAEIAILRYGTDYQDYFSEQTKAKNLALEPLSRVEYRVVLSEDSPLAKKPTVTAADLEPLTEIMHRDTFYSLDRREERGRIYTVDRMAQFQLLKESENAFLWSEPLPESVLGVHRLVQRPCEEGGTVYQNALVYKPQCAMSELERDFLEALQSGKIPL